MQEASDRTQRCATLAPAGRPGDARRAFRGRTTEIPGPCHSTFDDVKGGTYTIMARSLRHMNILQAAAYLKTLNNKQLERCGVCVAERR